MWNNLFFGVPLVICQKLRILPLLLYSLLFLPCDLLNYPDG
ncbi:hypothetical protein GXM_03227 [Nostoc sphaeroides CCNUC1]|uniref:Uncharacterized protein n=1 Tax=Nostoc sphaeroides CCNUC1 TaxID=2653204 RepID=A0A5P8VZB5_9NOSO|nr:hypothetical protein GXM_03227 [Nostoc sphaeroides CCNUC1]